MIHQPTKPHRGSGCSPSDFAENGYPTTASLPNSCGGNVTMPNSYYGQFAFKFTSAINGSFALSAPVVTFANGSTNLQGFSAAPGGATLYEGYSSSLFVLNKNISSSIKFSFGLPILGIADNGSGKLRVTSVNVNSLITTTLALQISNLTGANGLQTCTLVDSTHFDILSVNFASATYSVNAYAIVSGILVPWSWPSSFFSANVGGISNLYLCQLADETDVLAGRQIKQSLIDSIKAIKPFAVRTMDMQSTINSAATGFGVEGNRVDTQECGSGGLSWVLNDPEFIDISLC